MLGGASMKIPFFGALLVSATLLAGPFGTVQAASVSVTFTLLTGVTGGSPAGTGVYKADLSSLPLGQIASLTIRDNSSGLGGSPGQFSGFDLDAIVLSTTSITDATQVGTLVHTGTFNFATSVLVPGAQRAPADPALFGTIGGQVNNAMATLNVFDANSTTAIPGALGFVSMGDNGQLTIDLTTALATGGALYLYIGEVGNNGEVAASSISVSDTPGTTPLPAALPLFATGLGAFGLLGWRRKRKQAA